MARAKKTALATTAAAGGKSLVNIDAELAKEVATLRDAIGQSSGNKIKVEPSGNFVLPDGSNLGDEIQVVIVDFVSKNTFYSTPFNRDNPSPPDCYAIGKVIKVAAIPAVARFLVALPIQCAKAKTPIPAQMAKA